MAGNTAEGTAPSAAWVAQAQQLLARNGVAVNPVSLRLINTLWPANSLTGPRYPGKLRQPRQQHL